MMYLFDSNIFQRPMEDDAYSTVPDFVDVPASGDQPASSLTWQGDWALRAGDVILVNASFNHRVQGTMTNQVGSPGASIVRVAFVDGDAFDPGIYVAQTWSVTPQSGAIAARHVVSTPGAVTVRLQHRFQRASAGEGVIGGSVIQGYSVTVQIFRTVQPAPR